MAFWFLCNIINLLVFYFHFFVPFLGVLVFWLKNFFFVNECIQKMSASSSAAAAAADDDDDDDDARCRHIFAAWDTNGDGVLDYQEVLCGSLQAGMESDEVSMLFSHLDIDGDARVSADEFERGYAAFKRAAAASTAQRACVKCGGLDPETWDGGNTFHCYGCKESLPEERWSEELGRMRATEATERKQAPTDAEREARQVRRGVNVGWLKGFVNE